MNDINDTISDIQFDSSMAGLSSAVPSSMFDQEQELLMKKVNQNESELKQLKGSIIRNKTLYH